MNNDFRITKQAITINGLLKKLRLDYMSDESDHFVFTKHYKKYQFQLTITQFDSKEIEIRLNKYSKNITVIFEKRYEKNEFQQLNYAEIVKLVNNIEKPIK